MTISSKHRWDWLIPRDPERRMYRRCIIPLLLFLGLFAVYGLLGSHSTSATLRTVLVLLPLLPYLWVFIIYFDYLRECDELERKIELEAIAFAALLCLFTALIGLMLNLAQVLPSSFDGYDFLAISILSLSLGYFVVRYWLMWRNSR